MSVAKYWDDTETEENISQTDERENSQIDKSKESINLYFKDDRSVASSAISNNEFAYDEIESIGQIEIFAFSDFSSDFRLTGDAAVEFLEKLNNPDPERKLLRRRILKEAREEFNSNF